MSKTQLSTEDPLVVDFRQSGDSSQVFEESPLLTSHGTSWTDIVLEYHDQPGLDTGEIVAPIHQIGLCCPSISNPAERWLDGKFQTENLDFGDIVIVPAGAVHRSQWKHRASFFVLGFEPSWFEQLGQDWPGCQHSQLIPHAPPLKDPLLQAFLFALKTELETEGLNSNLYVDQLKTALGLHLLRQYATRPPKLHEYENGLSRYQLKQAIAYIHGHLDQTIKLADIAQLLGMSQYYFCRQFRNSMGIPPYQYVIKQRVERAKQLLRKDQQRAIADIALDCGFNSQSHLAKHFRQLTGMTAKSYRKH